MNEINYEHLTANIKEMINLLEYDSMRSAGKAKMNAGQLEALYSLLDRYNSMFKVKEQTSTTAATKPAAKKKG
jgi:hypothetical protein|tara:strand:+ start:396 stop:614 length:219 start_codon:yes stop_codon:yes gene_type:complete